MAIRFSTGKGLNFMQGMMTGSDVGAKDIVEIPDSLVQIVANAIEKAWHKLISGLEPHQFCSFKEDDITEHLHMILGEFDDSAPANGLDEFAQLQTPVRGGEVANHDGSNPGKKPDLVFRPLRGYFGGKVGNTVTAGIFVECKPIDSSRPIGSTYCNKGLIRFVNGDYAWRTDKALMIGYVRNLSSLPGGLENVLAEENMQRHLACDGRVFEKNKTAKGETVWSTSHKRSFKLENHIAGDIEVSHLWLQPKQPCEKTRSRGS